MIRGFVAYLLTLVLVVTGLSLAQARGAAPLSGVASMNGAEVEICTGIGVTTISVGSDGQPVKTQHVCPDGAQHFVVAFHVPLIDQPEERLVQLTAPVPAVAVATPPELVPSARGPPVLI